MYNLVYWSGYSFSLLQGIFPSQGSNPGLPHYRQILYQLSHKGSPRILEWVAYAFSSRSSWLRNWTGFSCFAGGFFTNRTIREVKIPYVQGQRRSPRKMLGGAKSHLESNPVSARGARRAQTNLVCTRTQRLHRDWAKNVSVSPAEVWVSSGLLQGQGHWVQQTWVWHKPSWRRSPFTPP